MTNHTVRASIIAALLLLAGAGCSSAVSPADSPDTPSPASTNKNTESENANPVPEGQTAAGRYEPYDESKLSYAETGDVVLFFKADWCPTCIALDRDIKKKADAIPSDLTILTLNYDTELALRRKYNVTTQHTLVQVDARGNMITKWSGGNTLQTILSRIQ